jgi:hypothetical protein
MKQPAIQNGYLVLVDLSGYTPFMASAELDHAQGILSNLLDLLCKRLTPTLTLAEIEGDALFLYAPGYRLTRGETLLELIETTYVAFRDAMRTMKRSATCPCHACQVMSTLDLKFVTHCGEYVLQNQARGAKPVGSCVNLAHRLLKNPVTESTGWGAYALFTEAALERMGIRPHGMHTDIASYEHFGECGLAAIDLHHRYAELTSARNVSVPVDSHYKRVQWESGSDWGVVEQPMGRTGPGAHNHCANSDFIEEVIDWRPFEYYTVRLRRSVVRFMITGELREEGEQTVLRWSMVMEGGAPRALRALTCRFFAVRLMRAPERFDRLDRLIAEEVVPAVDSMA